MKNLYYEFLATEKNLKWKIPLFVWVLKDFDALAVSWVPHVFGHATNPKNPFTFRKS